MTGNGAGWTPHRLVLRSRLSDIPQVSPWIDTLALRYDIPPGIQFAMNLCLEEAISNIVHHGYVGTDEGSIMVQFTTPPGAFMFTIDDTAPMFNPLDDPLLPALNPEEGLRVGGQGLRLLRQFADKIEYEATSTGNRLCIRFSATAAGA